MLENTRPLSPHLQIYKLPVVALSSICHRITGFILFIYMLLMSWCLILGSYIDMSCIISFTSGMRGLVFFAPFVFASFYHLLNGVRYLAWSVGYGYDMKDAERSCYFVALGAFLCTFLMLYFIYRELI